MMADFKMCPACRHKYNRKVERRIRLGKESLEKTISNQQLSLIPWKTIAEEVQNAFNDLPLAFGNNVGNLGNMDLITSNRLKHGRNNGESSVSPMNVVENYLKILEKKKIIFKIQFET